MKVKENAALSHINLSVKTQLNPSTSLSPVVVCPCSVAALGRAWSGAGAELGPGPRVRATDRGAGREAFSRGGREALSAACGFRAFLELLGLLSGLCSVLLFTQEAEEPPWAAGHTTESKQGVHC